MREIKFRGKVNFGAGCDKNGTWVYGSLVKTNQKSYYGTPYCRYDIIDVDGEEWLIYKDNCKDGDTIGQYTGLTDKNGKEIYEGDIVRIKYAFSIFEDAITVVKYHETHCQFVLHAPGKQYYFMFADNVGIGKFTNGIEVIGNIYDNPELIKGEQR